MVRDPFKGLLGAARVLQGRRFSGSFTFKLDILAQTKFQLREEKPLVKEEAAE